MDPFGKPRDRLGKQDVDSVSMHKKRKEEALYGSYTAPVEEQSEYSDPDYDYDDTRRYPQTAPKRSDDSSNSMELYDDDWFALCVPRRPRTGSGRRRRMTTQPCFFNSSEATSPSANPSPSTQQEDLDEQEVAEALFDLANMFHKPPPPKADVEEHNYRGPSRLPEAGRKRESPDHRLELPDKLYGPGSQTALKRSAGRDGNKPRLVGPFGALSEKRERDASYPKETLSEAGKAKENPPERFTKPRMEGPVERLARGKEGGVEKTIPTSVDTGKDERVQITLAKEPRLVDTDRDRLHRPEPRGRDSGRTVVSPRASVKHEPVDTTQEMRQNSVEVARAASRDFVRDVESKPVKEESAWLPAQVNFNKHDQPPVCSTSANTPLAAIPQSLVGNWVGVPGALQMHFPQPANVTGSNFVDPKTVMPKKDQDPILAPAGTPKGVVVPAKPRFKRCACHVYIAHFIAQQQLQQQQQSHAASCPGPKASAGVAVGPHPENNLKHAAVDHSIPGSSRGGQLANTARPIAVPAKDRQDCEVKSPVPIPQLPPTAFPFLPPTILVSGPMTQPNVSMPRSGSICPPGVLTQGGLPLHPQLVPLHGNGFHFPFQLPLSNGGSFPPGLAQAGPGGHFLGAHQFPFAGVFPSQLQAMPVGSGLRPELLLTQRAVEGKDMDRAKFEGVTQEELVKYVMQPGFLDSRGVPLLSAARIGLIPPEAMGPGAENPDHRRHPMLR